MNPRDWVLLGMPGLFAVFNAWACAVWSGRFLDEPRWGVLIAASLHGASCALSLFSLWEVIDTILYCARADRRIAELERHLRDDR